MVVGGGNEKGENCAGNVKVYFVGLGEGKHFVSFVNSHAFPFYSIKKESCFPDVIIQ